MPIPFGLKLAGYAAALARSRERLRRLRKDALLLQFGGAAGTLAALNDHGLIVAERLAALLDLPLPDAPWHSHRDRLAEVASALAILTGTCGKIARDVSLLMQTDVAEAFEPAAPGRGTSSTMPHKRNPTAAAVALAAATIAPNLAATIFAAEVQEHERALGGWQAEWPTFPALALVTSGAVAAIVDIAQGLEIDSERMRVNLGATRGQIMTEAVTFALAAKLGRQQARTIVEERAGRRPPPRASCKRCWPRTSGSSRISTSAIWRSCSSPWATRAPPRPSSTGWSARCSFVPASVHKHLNPREETCLSSTPMAARSTSRSRGPRRAPVLMLSNSLGTTLAHVGRAGRAVHQALPAGALRPPRPRQVRLPKGPYTMERLGRDVLAVLDALDIKKINWCGLSMGGMVGQWLGANAPERVERLVLTNTSSYFPDKAAWNDRLKLVREKGVASFAAANMERWFTKGFRERSPEAVAPHPGDVRRHPARRLHRLRRGGARHGPSRAPPEDQGADPRHRRPTRSGDDAGGERVHQQATSRAPSIHAARRRAHVQRRAAGCLHGRSARVPARLTQRSVVSQQTSDVVEHERRADFRIQTTDH